MKARVVGSSLIALAVAGCGSNPATPAPAWTGPNAVTSCTSKQLQLTISDHGAAAGSHGFLINFKNTSHDACTLEGFPGVSYVQAPDGEPVGASADRNGDPAGEIKLTPGDSAHALLTATNVANYPPIDCAPTPVAGLSVYPPNSPDAIYIAHPATACHVATAYQLSVSAVSTNTW